MSTDNKPRPYSWLNPATGRIEWVAPGDGRDSAAPAVKVRSRLETDAEVQARLRAAGKDDGSDFGLAGVKLDQLLKYYSLPPRQHLDEIV